MQRRWWRLALCLAALAMASTAAMAAQPPRAPRVIAYVLDRGAPLPQVDVDRLDTVIYSFAVVDDAHRVHLPRAGMGERLSQLARQRDDAGRPQVLLAIGGWGAGNFSEAAASAHARRTFAQTAVELVRRHDLDGLDIDWEYPAVGEAGISHSPADRGNFPLLLQALREELDTLATETDRHYRLTIAAADGDAAQGLDLPRIVPLVDAIHLMTYDFFGSPRKPTGHHAGLFRSAGATSAQDRDTARAIDEFLAAGVPPAKLVPGAAFYGKKFRATTADNAGLHQPFESEIGFLTWRELRDGPLTDDAFERHRDPQAQAPWLWNPATREFISYEDPESIRAKAAFARERGLGGLMFWELGGDDADGSLLDAIHEGLHGATH
ncbi:glycoside hydrolase family 18 protein [Luteimonas composti]